ncbi:hypothetical protein MMC17_001286 [Xylographa soralifera]|nr:hypothetical protein [Xylographa soralifera]
MPPSNFEDFLSGDIDITTIDFDLPIINFDIPPLSELDPPLPPLMPGTERLLWMKRYIEAFRNMKATNLKMLGGIMLYQRVMPKFLQKFYEKSREARRVEADLATALRELARVKRELETANKGIGERDEVIRDLTTMTTFGEGGVVMGT